jgi:sterol desaturase/sphingolipid hydroxylase (fatty acid hydroxylase superfamily)
VLGGRFWKGRTHNLSRMNLADLVRAYFTYPAILTYLVLGVIATVLAILQPSSTIRLLIAAALATLLYPLVWYSLHRFVLHGRYLYKWRQTAAVWKRIHFDHHQDPHNLRVLFGALYTTLPTIAIVTIPLGWLIGGIGGSCAAFASGVFTTCFYEFCHCVQHLNHTPKSAFLQRIKRLHLAHHFHNETGNFGITNFFWDRVFGTFYPKAKAVARSETVFNLGYTAAEAERYPWVAAISGGTRGDGNPRRFRTASADDPIADEAAGLRPTGS